MVEFMEFSDFFFEQSFCFFESPSDYVIKEISL